MPGPWLAMLCAGAAPVWAASPRDPSIEVERLGNGVRLIVRPVADADRVELRAVVHVGWRDDPLGREGMAHLLQHLTLDGTEHFTATKLHELDADRNAHTQLRDRSTTWQLSVAPEDLAEGVAVIADLLRSPQYDAGDVTRQRAVLAEELERPGAPGDIGTAGSLLSIGKLDAPSIDQFRAAWVRPERVDVVVTGPVGADVRRVVADALGSWQASAKGAERERGSNEADKPEYEFRHQPVTWVGLVLPAPATSSRREAARRIAMQVLEQALQRRGVVATGDDPVVLYTRGGDADKALKRLLDAIAEVPTSTWTDARDEIAARGGRELDAFEWARLLVERCRNDGELRDDPAAGQAAIATIAPTIRRTEVEDALRDMLRQKRFRLLVAGPAKVNGTGFVHRAEAALWSATVVDIAKPIPPEQAAEIAAAEIQATTPVATVSKPGNAAPEPTLKPPARVGYIPDAEAMARAEAARRAEIAESEAAKADADAKAEAARIEIARAEAEKAEAAKAAAARAEVAKAEAEKAMAEAAKAEAAKAEAAKAEAANAEAAKAEVARAELAKAELAKVEAAKADVAKVEAAKAAAARADVAKAELAKVEAAKADVARVEAAKAAAARAEVAKAEVAKAEVAKAEVAKAEVAKAQVAKAEAAKAELAKAEVARADAAKAEVARAEAAKAEVAKAEVAKAEVAKAEVAKAEVAKAEVAKAEVAKAEVAKAEAAKAATARTEVAKTEVARTEAAKAEVARAEAAKAAAARADAERRDAAKMAAAKEAKTPTIYAAKPPLDAALAPLAPTGTLAAQWWSPLNLPIGDGRVQRWDETSVELKYAGTDWGVGHEAWVKTLVSRGWHIETSSADNGRATTVLSDGTQRLTVRFGVPPGAFGYVTQVSVARPEGQ